MSSTVDARDHLFVKGVQSRLPDGSRRLALAETLDRAEARGASGAEINDLEKEWMAGVDLITFNQGKVSLGISIGWLLKLLAAVEKAINESSLADRGVVVQQYQEAVKGKSNTEARDIANNILGAPVDWDWDRTFLRFSP